MFSDTNGLLFSPPFTHAQHPGQGQGQQTKQVLYPLWFGHVCLLQIQPFGFQGIEGGFDGPALLINGQCVPEDKSEATMTCSPSGESVAG